MATCKECGDEVEGTVGDGETHLAQEHGIKVNPKDVDRYFTVQELEK